MSTKKLKAAVIGVGKWGSLHANIYKKLRGVKLCALATRTRVSARLRESEYNVPCYTSINKLLQRESPDLVTIAIPPIKNKQIAIECLEAGCHVFLEKPIAMNVKEAKAIIQAAKKYRRKLMIGHIERFNPVVIKAKKILDEKKLGKLLLYSSIRSGYLPQKFSGDVLLDLGIHDLDLFRYLTNTNIIKVWGQRLRKVNKKFDDFYSLVCKTNKALVFQYQTDWWRKSPQRETRIIGSRGELHLDFVNKEIRLVTEEAPTGKKIKVHKNVDQLEKEIRAFIRCLRKDSKPPISGEEGLKALELYSICRKEIKTKS